MLNRWYSSLALELLSMRKIWANTILFVYMGVVIMAPISIASLTGEPLIIVVGGVTGLCLSLLFIKRASGALKHYATASRPPRL